MDEAANVVMARVRGDGMLRLLARLEGGESRTLGPLAPAARRGRRRAAGGRGDGLVRGGGVNRRQGRICGRVGLRFGCGRVSTGFRRMGNSVSRMNSSGSGVGSSRECGACLLLYIDGTGRSRLMSCNSGRVRWRGRSL